MDGADYQFWKRTAKQFRRRLAGDVADSATCEPGARAALPWALGIVALASLDARRLSDSARWPALTAGQEKPTADALQADFSHHARQLPWLFDRPLDADCPPPPEALAECLELLAPRAPAAARQAQRALRNASGLGWFYQYWRADERRRALARLRSMPGGKFTAADVPLATQLYTHPYMVQFLVHNTLGAHGPASATSARTPSSDWPMLVDLPRPAADRRPLASLTVLDPACGAGHFLVEAFDVLYRLRAAERPAAPAEDVCREILAEQLFGIDLDEQALAIAAATLWIRAAERIGRLPDAPLTMNLAAPAADDLPRRLHPSGKLGAASDPQRRAVLRVLDELRRAERWGTLTDLPAMVREAVRVERLRVEPRELAGLCCLVREQLGNIRCGTTRLLELVDRTYDVVVTNPPFLGCRTMDDELRQFIERYYPSAKRDLYTSFMVRSFELTRPGGRTGLVVQHSWMFLRCYRELRAAGPPGRGLLREASLETLVHLGPGSFPELSGEVVNTVLVTWRREPPEPQHRFRAWRLIGLGRSNGRAGQLEQAIAGELPAATHEATQLALTLLPMAPLVYWVDPRLVELLHLPDSVARLGGVKQGLATGDNRRFVRFWFECSDPQRWRPYAKGGGLRRWYGLRRYRVDWGGSGERLRAARDASGRRTSVVRNERTYFQPGITYSLMARGSLGVRLLDASIYDVASMSIFPADSRWNRDALMGLLNTSIYTYLARLVSQDIKFNTSYISRLPLPASPPAKLERLARAAVALKAQWVRDDPLEEDYRPPEVEGDEDLVGLCRRLSGERLRREAWLHAVEGAIERRVATHLELDAALVETIWREVGVPAGCLPRRPHDALPEPPGGSGALPEPAELLDGVPVLERSAAAAAAERVERLVARREERVADAGAAESGNGRAPALEIPPETYCEQLARAAGLHPASVAALLKRLVASGWRCRAEERRTVTDLLTSVVLRLAGHRWPAEQPPDAAAEPAAETLLLTPLAGHRPLAARVRQRLAAMFPAESARLDEQLAEILGAPLDNWLSGSMFRYHVQQYQRRPIVWQLASARRRPAFSCLVYYHGLNRHTPERIAKLVERAMAECPARRDELSAFRHRLAEVPRWTASAAGGGCGGEDPDPNDGVRVNIAPWELAGLLAAPVLGRADAQRALADRARWRSAPA